MGVNLNDPKKCILVEVNPLFCGLSVLPSWASLKKYNLHALTSSDDKDTKKVSPAGAKVSKPQGEVSTPVRQDTVAQADTIAPTSTAPPASAANGVAPLDEETKESTKRARETGSEQVSGG